MKLAVPIAVLMHLLLFLALTPAGGYGLAGALVPPKTSYLAQSDSMEEPPGEQVRMVWSPVVFSLPTEMGFSRELNAENLRTRLVFSQQAQSESFLNIDLSLPEAATHIDSPSLMLTGACLPDPALPEDPSPGRAVPAAMRRVYMTPGLSARLNGEVALPPELNEASNHPWQVDATVSVSRDGAVQHVFLEQPLESQALNLKVLQMLYGLRFKSGPASAEGAVSIYSPEAVGSGESP